MRISRALIAFGHVQLWRQLRFLSVQDGSRPVIFSDLMSIKVAIKKKKLTCFPQDVFSTRGNLN